MRRAVVAFAATLAVGILALLLIGAFDKRDEAFTLGVTEGGPVVTLRPDARMCQLPIEAAADFDAVRFKAGTFGQPGPPLDVTIANPTGQRFYGEGRIEGGYADDAHVVADVGHVTAGKQIAVCLENVGDRRVELYGNAALAHAPSGAVLGQRALAGDLAVVFLRDDGASLLSLIPDMVDRMSLFHGSWVEPWVVWLLLALAFLGVPAIVAVGLARARP